MSAPLSDYWTVEYSFHDDALSVRPFGDYLSATQRSFFDGRFFDSVVLALHPTRQGANDECEVWKERRNTSRLTLSARLQQLRRFVAGLESEL